MTEHISSSQDPRFPTLKWKVPSITVKGLCSSKLCDLHPRSRGMAQCGHYFLPLGPQGASQGLRCQEQIMSNSEKCTSRSFKLGSFEGYSASCHLLRCPPVSHLPLGPLLLTIGRGKPHTAACQASEKLKAPTLLRAAPPQGHSSLWPKAGMPRPAVV